MYDFHYNYIKEKYGSRTKLLFTDKTVWFMKQTRDAYKDLWADKDKFANSDYAKDSPYFDATNKKAIGKFKDEAAGIPITEFIGLRNKTYSYVKDNRKNEKTAKGIRKYVIKKNITNQDYKDTL